MIRTLLKGPRKTDKISRLLEIHILHMIFTQFDCIKRKKFLEHILSLTERFWKQLVLLHKAIFCIEIFFHALDRIKFHRFKKKQKITNIFYHNGIF